MSWVINNSGKAIKDMGGVVYAFAEWNGYEMY